MKFFNQSTQDTFMIFKKNAGFNAFSLISISILFATLSLIIGCEKESEITQKAYKVGIVLFGDSRQPQVEGFKAELSKLGYKPGDTIHYITQNAKNKRPQLKPMVEELLAQEVDLLVAAGGLEADTMKKVIKDETPVVVLYVNAIVERDLVKTRLDPGWNVTGVDNLNAELSSKRIEIMRDLLPSMKKVLILYYKKIAPSRIGVEQATEIAKNMNISIDSRAVNNRAEIQQIMESLKPGDVDAMLTVPTAPIDNALKEIILPQIKRLKLPLMTHSRPLAAKGSMASYGAHFYDLGTQAARLANKILTGTAANKIPFETPKKFIYTLNSDVQKEFNIELTELAKSQINEYITTNK